MGRSNPLDTYVGIPYIKGESGGSGCDCWGLVVMVYRDLLGVELPLYQDYRTSAADVEAVANLVAGAPDSWHEISGSEATYLDLVIIRAAGIESHVGLLAGSGMILHTTPQVGRSVSERASSIRLSRRISRYARYCH